MPSDQQGRVRRGFRDVADDMRRRIGTGEWPPGTMLPGRSSLAQEFGVAVATANRAVELLSRSGELVTEPNRGTFVGGKPAGKSATVPTESRGVSRLAQPAVLGLLTALPRLHVDVGMPWNRDMLRAVDGEFSRAGGSTLLCDRAAGRGWYVKDWLSPVEGVRDLVDRGADLVVINSFAQDAGGMPEAVAAAGSLGVPCIFADSTFLDVPVPQISFDNRSAGYEAARHLCQRGARRIVCLAPFRALWQTHRVKGAKVAAAVDAVPADVYPLDCPDPAPPSGLPAVGEERAVAFAHQLFLAEGKVWLGATNGLLAVLACNDPLAYGIMGAADEMGLVPGRDFLVMGFDDRSEAAALGLSTMRAPARAVGREAVTTAVRMLNGERVPSRISVPWDLIARTSTNNSQPDRNTESP